MNNFKSRTPGVLSRLILVLIFSALISTYAQARPGFRTQAQNEKLQEIRERVAAYEINPRFKDDIYGLLVVKTALKAVNQGSGGIGACLVEAGTGRVVETGRNRQYTTYFRSDLHAEMDLLNRYEDRMKKTHSPETGANPRDCGGLILVSSVEPCPMCLTRIINAGIKTVLYVVEDKEGGMVSRMDGLPPFWQAFASDREFRKADCSPALGQLAHDLFHLSSRKFARHRSK